MALAVRKEVTIRMEVSFMVLWDGKSEVKLCRSDARIGRHVSVYLPRIPRLPIQLQITDRVSRIQGYDIEH
jgi:hypothetical protein